MLRYTHFLYCAHTIVTLPPSSPLPLFPLFFFSSPPPPMPNSHAHVRLMSSPSPSPSALSCPIRLVPSHLSCPITSVLSCLIYLVPSHPSCPICPVHPACPVPSYPHAHSMPSHPIRPTSSHPHPIPFILFPSPAITLFLCYPLPMCPLLSFLSPSRAILSHLSYPTPIPSVISYLSVPTPCRPPPANAIPSRPFPSHHTTQSFVYRFNTDYTWLKVQHRWLLRILRRIKCVFAHGRRIPQLLRFGVVPGIPTQCHDKV